MTNYSIDASVYAFPFHNNAGSAKEIESYFKNIYYISLLVSNKSADDKMRPRNIKCFLFENDIKLIIKNKELYFSEEDEIPLRETLKKGELLYLDPNDLRRNFEVIMKRLGNTDPFDYAEDIKNKIIFERWFGIENIIFIAKKGKTVPPGDAVVKNIREHLALLSALNKYVCKNSKNHILILNKNMREELKTIIVPPDFEIKTFSDRLGNHVRIKNLPDKIELEELDIKLSTPSVLMKNSYQNYTEEEFRAKIKGFPYLVLGSEVETGIIQYGEKIKEEIKNLSGDKKEEAEKWLLGFQDSILANLKALNDFAATLKNTFLCTGAFPPHSSSPTG